MPKSYQVPIYCPYKVPQILPAIHGLACHTLAKKVEIYKDSFVNLAFFLFPYMSRQHDKDEGETSSAHVLPSWFIEQVHSFPKEKQV